MILPSAPTYTKSADFWLPTGDVVLEAEGTAFRAFSSILKGSSAVFREMLGSSALDRANAELYEETACPVVHLSDGAQDLGWFLRALHEPGFYDPETVDSFLVVAGVLRLSTKYAVPHLRTRSLRLLSSLFPPTLPAFEASLTTPQPRIQPFPGRNFAAVNLARECALHTVLPVALFRSCTGTTVAEILDGAFGKDGVVHHALDWQDKRLCLIARAVLETRARKYTMRFLMEGDPEAPPDSPTAMSASSAPVHTPASAHPPARTHTHSRTHSRTHSGSAPNTLRKASAPPVCTTREACDSVRLRYLRGVELTNANYGKVNPLLTGFRWDTFEKEVCAVCFRKARRSFEREKQALWEDLPTIFQMGTWAALRAKMEGPVSVPVPVPVLESRDAGAGAGVGVQEEEEPRADDRARRSNSGSGDRDILFGDETDTCIPLPPPYSLTDT